MKTAQALQIAIVGSLALSFGSAGTSAAAKRRPTTTVARRATTTVSKAKTATPASPPDAAATLVVSGFVADTLTEVRLSTPRCHPAVAANVSGGFEFDGPKSRYALTLSLPKGATTFPTTNGQAFVRLIDLSDATKNWIIGSSRLAQATGTAMFDGAQGTIDAEMLPDPPNPAVTAIHVKGSFTCAYGSP